MCSVSQPGGCLEQAIHDFERWFPTLLSFIGIVISVAILVLVDQPEFGVVFLTISSLSFIIFGIEWCVFYNENSFCGRAQFVLGPISVLPLIASPYVLAIVGLVKSQEELGQNLLMINNILFLTLAGICPILYFGMDAFLRTILDCLPEIPDKTVVPNPTNGVEKV